MSSPLAAGGGLGGGAGNQSGATGGGAASSSANGTAGSAGIGGAPGSNGTGGNQTATRGVAPFVTISVTLPGSSSESMEFAQVPGALVFSASSAGCGVSDVTGYVGQWLSTVLKCSPPPTKAGGVLLGWATTPNFPVAIAQRQANYAWGVYETFNVDGTIASVFIPAGWDAYVTGDNTLYPIWNK